MTNAFLYRRAIPAAAKFTEWMTPDGWPLRRFDWPAETASPRGSILFQGGRGDIVEKYLELLAHWHAQGWSITSFDWRGQGGSGRLSPDPHVGHVGSFDTYIADLGAFWADWAPGAAGPKVLMGHSMGGHLVSRGLVERVVAPDAAVLIAPMLGLHSPFGATLGELLAALLARIGRPERAAWKDNERPATRESRQALLTHDAGRYEDELWWQQAKPQLLLGPPSWRWVAEAFRSTRRVREDPAVKSLDVPVLMLVPLADKLVLPRAALAIAAMLPDARVVSFGDEAAHEVLREADAVRNRAIAELDMFLAARAPGG